MSAVFADTFYFLAFLNPQDEHHERVRQFSRQFRRRMVTTSWVLTVLPNWSPVAVVTNIFETVQCTDPAGTNLAQRFYRVR